MWVHENCKTANNRLNDMDTLLAWRKILATLGLSDWPCENFTGDVMKLVSDADRHLMLHTLFKVNVLRSNSDGIGSRISLQPSTTYLKRYTTWAGPKTKGSYEGIIARAMRLHCNNSTAVRNAKQIFRLEGMLERLSYVDTSMMAKFAIKQMSHIQALITNEHWDWVRYFFFLFGNNTITGSTMVFIEDPAFFARFSLLFDDRDYGTAIANYVGFKTMVTFSAFLPGDYRFLNELDPGYDIMLADSKIVDSKLVTCTLLVEKMFRYGVGIAAKLSLSKEFATTYLTHYEEQLAAIFGEARRVVKGLLRSRLSWFSEQDADQAMRKLDRMTLVLGTEDNFAQYEIYRQTPPLAAFNNGKGVLETVFAILSHASSVYWGALSNDSRRAKAAYDNAYSTSVFESESEYQPTDNFVFVPTATVSQLSTLSHKIPVLLYPVILTQLVRGVLRALVQSNAFFKDGVSSKTWWGNDSVDDYNNITECLQQQYRSSATLDGDADAGVVHGRSTLAQRENDFLDNAVLWPLYLLYERASLRQNATRLFYWRNDERVNSKALFFYNYASAFCVESDKASRRKQRRLVMTPAKSRLNVPLSNFPPFLQAFSCPTPGKLQSRCSVWKDVH
ncbi:hypothetical protein HPB48_011572 [Haemaphysalis longicornis]|uniref:Uncharacterized protein n=1 Tax=Haemaphysalis longicornis TaxID=44386 RepID=A0A9J6FYD1_HAELO|nr:hypothetical protein HPB48_011572 [Haemaphysalis longicornis]